MLSAGALKDRVWIVKPETHQDERTGEQVTEWKKEKKVWANVQFKRGAQALNMGEEWLSRSVSITMRDNNVINERCRISWDGKLYAIDSFNRSWADGSITIVAVAIDESQYERFDPAPDGPDSFITAEGKELWVKNSLLRK